MAASKVQPIRTPEEIDRAAIVDEWGRLDTQVKAFAPIKTRHEKLSELIRSWYPDEKLPPQAVATAPGTSCDVLVGARGNERHIVSMSMIFKLLGQGKFLSLCKIALNALEDELGGEKALEPHVVWKQTGPRKLTSLPKFEQA